MVNAYTIMMIIVIIMSLLMQGNKKGSNRFINFACLAMFILMAFRDVTKIGVDSISSYLHSYQEITSLNWFEVFRREYNGLFALFMKIINVISNGNYQVFIIIISAFCMISFSHMLKKYSVSPIVSICGFWGLAFYIFMFDGFKQAMAMSILIYAFDAIIEKKPLKFYLLVLIAALFHHPALIFIPAYLGSNLKVRRGLYVLLIIIAFYFVYLFRADIINFMLNAYEYGELSEAYSEMNVEFIGGGVIVYLFIIVTCLVLRPPDQENDFIYTVLLRFMIVATLLMTFCYYNNVFKRLADYYAYYSILLIPLALDRNHIEENSLISNENQITIKGIGSIAFSLFGIVYFAIYIQNSASSFLPYKFFW